jgi:ASC-1-like (ASCH) protein
MKYSLETNDRPFNAIRAGTKKVEGRVPTSYDNTPYDKIKPSDRIAFIRESDKKIMETEVLYVKHYKNARAMLESEGTERVLSSGGDIEQGVASYNSFREYKENISKFGIYAICIEPVE